MSNEINKSSNRSFGIIFFIVFLMIGFYPFLKQEDLRVWALVISFVFLILGILDSKILKPLNKIWFKFGLFLGKIISPLIMGLIFFLVVTQIGVFMRILGKDLINLKYKKYKKSYWIEKTGPNSKMKNQF